MAQNEAQQLQQQIGVNSVIELTYPTDNVEGGKRDKITVRRVRVGDLRAVSHITNEVEQEMALFCRITGLVSEDLDLLDIADYKKLQDWFRHTQKGATPSAEQTT